MDATYDFVNPTHLIALLIVLFTVSLVASASNVETLLTRYAPFSETIEAVSGRPVMAKHNQFGFYRPSAVVIARALTDIPLLAIQCTMSSVIIYFLVRPEGPVLPSSLGSDVTMMINVLG